MASITEHEEQQIENANASGRPAVVFVHGLWLLPSSWDRWQTLFEKRGYAALAPGWPDDPETVGEAWAHPEVVQNLSQISLQSDNVGGAHRLGTVTGSVDAGYAVQLAVLVRTV